MDKKAKKATKKKRKKNNRQRLKFAKIVDAFSSFAKIVDLLFDSDFHTFDCFFREIFAWQLWAWTVLVNCQNKSRKNIAFHDENFTENMHFTVQIRTVKCMFSVKFSSWKAMFFRDLFWQYSRTVQAHNYHAKISRKKQSEVWKSESNNKSTILANRKKKHFSRAVFLIC